VIDGDAVVHELVVAASPDAVFDMFMDPVKLVTWIGISADLESQPGGRFRFEVMPGQFCEGEYVEIDRPRRVVVTWGWSDPAMDLPPGSSRVEVRLTPAGTGTRLRLVHHQLPGNLRLLHDDGWTRFLARLDAVLAHRQPGAYPTEDPQARLAQLRRDQQGR
jgi:uncharacterized protein YndB with AHSA1/START domain